MRSRTSKGPSVVRFRPFAGSTGIDRTALLSVRFTARMDRASTQAAFSARIGTKKLKGVFSWAEGDTVLVFKPAAVLPYGVKVVMTVAGTATDRAGSRDHAPKSATFKVVAKADSRSAQPDGPHRPRTVGRGRLVARRRDLLPQAHELHPRRRLGHLERQLQQPGRERDRPAHPELRDQHRRLAAVRQVPGRIPGSAATSPTATRATGSAGPGYNGDYRENIGCRSAANPYASVLGTHLFFQSEKPCGGYCHYANIMSTKMKYVGIGVWVGHGRVRLVVDFWEG